MDGSIHLSAEECKSALSAYRHGDSASVARRAHILLLLDGGWSYRAIQDALFCGSDLIASVKRRFSEQGLDAALNEEAPAEATVPFWKWALCRWVIESTPRDFDFFRSRWSCELLAIMLREVYGLRKSAETVRRALHQLGFAWRRPRPTVGLSDPEYAEKMRAIRHLLNTLPDDEVAVFQDEVDVHLNPKIGSCWMPQGEQATVETPGNNVKRNVAGSLVWRTGTLLVSPPTKRRDAKAFLTHLDDLRRRLRGFKHIHVICDNAPFHTCRAVREYLEQWGHRITLHFLPKYAPETNPIERVWWHLHETITRNHRCQTIDELLRETYDWFEANSNHYLDMHHTFAQAA